MNENEGVIKFSLDYTNIPLPERIIESCKETLSTLNAWRNILKQLGMLGQNPERYAGLSFGNISIRSQPGNDAFLITGTQTGKLDYLQQQHFSLVTATNTENNSIEATGEIRPSSEALTHASIYITDPTAQAIIHIHYPLIWQMTSQLNLVATNANIAYGTSAMATAVANIVKSAPAVQSTVFAMLGHEDGIVAYGTNIEIVARTIIGLLALALKFDKDSTKNTT